MRSHLKALEEYFLIINKSIATFEEFFLSHQEILPILAENDGYLKHTLDTESERIDKLFAKLKQMKSTGERSSGEGSSSLKDSLADLEKRVDTQARAISDMNKLKKKCETFTQEFSDNNKSFLRLNGAITSQASHLKQIDKLLETTPRCECASRVEALEDKLNDLLDRFEFPCEQSEIGGESGSEGENDRPKYGEKRLPVSTVLAPAPEQDQKDGNDDLPGYMTDEEISPAKEVEQNVSKESVPE